MTLVRRLESGDQPKRRGFSAPRRPEQGEDRPLSSVKDSRSVAGGRSLAKRFVNAGSGAAKVLWIIVQQSLERHL